MKKIIAVIISSLFLLACSAPGPEAIAINKDVCSNCKMSISDIQFACEIITEKGRVYKFDDVSCLLHYKKENNTKMNNAKIYICDFLAPNNLTSYNELTFLEGEKINGPMGTNVAAFTVKDSATVYANNWGAKIISWNDVKQ